MQFKKSLGQHFLVDENIQKKIVNLLNISENDKIIEIGPGGGALTQHLVKKSNNLILIEKDYSLGEELKRKFPFAEIIIDDFLNWEFYIKDKVKIIGNLPYNVASQIILKVIENRDKWNMAVFMVQKEVAERIVASHGCKDYSILSVVVQSFCRVKKEFDVSPSCFFPKPNVVSSVVKFIPIDSEIKNFEKFFNFTKAIFYGRRKKLLNVLKNNPFISFNKDFLKFVKQNFGENVRVENLRIEDIKKLYLEGGNGIEGGSFNKKKY